MGFSKSDDYIDYTLLKKKGILKIPEEKKTPLKTEGGFIDFTSFGNSAGAQETAPSAAPETPAGSGAPVPAPNFDFLSNMAGVGASGATTETANPFANLETYGSPSSNALNAGNKEFEHLKVKIDDIEYKIDRFIERLDKLEEKLSKVNLG